MKTIELFKGETLNVTNPEYLENTTKLEQTVNELIEWQKSIEGVNLLFDEDAMEVAEKIRTTKIKLSPDQYSCNLDGECLSCGS